MNDCNMYNKILGNSAGSSGSGSSSSKNHNNNNNNKPVNPYICFLSVH